MSGVAQHSSSSNPPAMQAILTAVTDVIGGSGVGGGGTGLSIPQLLEMIAAYADPFVSSNRVMPGPVPGNWFIISCSIDHEWMLWLDIDSNQFVKHSITTGTGTGANPAHAVVGCLNFIIRCADVMGVGGGDRFQFNISREWRSGCDGLGYGYTI